MRHGPARARHFSPSSASSAPCSWPWRGLLRHGMPPLDRRRRGRRLDGRRLRGLARRDAAVADCPAGPPGPGVLRLTDRRLGALAGWLAADADAAASFGTSTYRARRGQSGRPRRYLVTQARRTVTLSRTSTACSPTVALLRWQNRLQSAMDIAFADIAATFNEIERQSVSSSRFGRVLRPARIRLSRAKLPYGTESASPSSRLLLQNAATGPSAAACRTRLAPDPADLYPLVRGSSLARDNRSFFTRPDEYVAAKSIRR
jgi:hypothetical protein